MALLIKAHFNTTIFGATGRRRIVVGKARGAVTRDFDAVFGNAPAFQIIGSGRGSLDREFLIIRGRARAVGKTADFDFFSRIGI